MNMNCDEVRPLLIDYLDWQLAPAVREKVEEHLKNCVVCSDELAQYKKLFDEMASTQLEQPSPALKEKFQTMLQSELNIAATMEMLKNREEPKPVTPRITPMWMKVAASILLVGGGMAAGMLLKNDKSTVIQMAGLKQEVQQMKETMLLNMLNEESASDRIQAVSYAEEISNPDKRIIQALLHTVNNDNNVNVRVAAANSVAKFSNDPKVIDALIASLKTQTEPLVQIVLITILTDKKATKAIEPIKAIISDKQTLPPVKQVAEQGLKKVI